MPASSHRTRLVLLGIAAGALLVRIAAAVAVERVARQRGTLCLFDDTAIYWQLAESIRLALPYEVDQFGIPHKALRTPGYPVFLAICQAIFGASATLGARLVQAVLGALCVPLVFRLTRTVWPRRSETLALVAAGFAAFEPYWVATSALLLSEAVFVPLMLVMLWGMAATWPEQGATRGPYDWVAAIASGVAAGLGVMVKPSWLLAPLAGCLLACRSVRNAGLALAVVAGMAMVMGPWAMRNHRAIGKPVATALWGGASLYDGLNPSADGSSDMRFLADPRYKNLSEVDQDRTFRTEAMRFARENPARVAQLALIKAARFWSPWPNASEFRASWSNLASAAVTLPMFAMLAAGVWTARHDGRALALLGGPLVYFFALHVVFVSSIRYRIPAQVPAFGLMAMGLATIWERLQRGGRVRAADGPQSRTQR